MSSPFNQPARYRRSPQSYSSAYGSSSSSESVYALIPPPPSSLLRHTMYTSKYPHDTPPTGSTFGSGTFAGGGQTLVDNLAGSYTQANSDGKFKNHRQKQQAAQMGPKTEHISDPTNILKKDTMPDLPPPRRFEYHDIRKERVDTLNPPQSMLTQSSTQTGKTDNFITKNALAVIMAQARKPVDDSVNYLKKDGYGEVPSYLDGIRESIAAERAYVHSVVQRSFAADRRHSASYNNNNNNNTAPRMRLMSEEDRLEMLGRLKAKWEQINRKYQGMTHLMTLDTVGKLTRKQECERLLEQLERSIARLSKPQIYVQDDEQYQRPSSY